MRKALRMPKRRGTAVVAVTLALATTGGVAYAVDSAVYYNGGIGSGGWVAGPEKLYLHYSEGASNDGRTICVDALYKSGTQYGSVICTNNSTGTHNTYPSSPTVLRAWGRPTVGNGVNAKLRYTTY